MRESYRMLVEHWKEIHRRDLEEPPRNEYDKFIKDMAKEEGWEESLYMPSPLFDKIGIEGNFVLMLLVNFQIRQRPDAEETNHGWFECPMERLLGPDNLMKAALNKRKQSKNLDLLEKRGFIRTRKSDDLIEVWIDFDWYAKEHLRGIKKMVQWERDHPDEPPHLSEGMDD